MTGPAIGATETEVETEEFTDELGSEEQVKFRGHIGKILRYGMRGVIWLGIAVCAACTPLPTQNAGQTLPSLPLRIVSPEPSENGDKPLFVSVTASNEVFLGDKKYELDKLGAELKAAHNEKPDQRIYFRGDVSISYGRSCK
jgi:hypothetical protein